MKIFNQLDIVDHTGHGIPIIVDKYGKDSFEISDNYIMVTIPFDKEVMATINVGVNVGVNVVEKVILEELVKNPQLTANDLFIIISKSKRTSERYLKHLPEKGYIERSAKICT